MWGLGLIVLCLFAFVIIGVISNITLTNQQDYYGVKQTTEAGAYDSVDQVVYKRGVCICVNKVMDTSGQVKFSSKTQYTVREPVNDNNDCIEPDKVDSSYEKCELLQGEYVLDPKVFTESVISRLGSIIKPSEIYDITVQEVIPYPPKVSVNIEYKQALNVDGEDRIGQIIPNKFDGIFEDTGAHSILEYADNKIDDWTLNCSSSSTPTSTTPSEPTPSTPSTPSDSGSCSWHYTDVAKCIDKKTGLQVTVSASNSGYRTCTAAVQGCKNRNWRQVCESAGYAFMSAPACSTAYQTWVITKKDGSTTSRDRTCTSGTPCSSFPDRISCRCKG